MVSLLNDFATGIGASAAGSTTAQGQQEGDRFGFNTFSVRGSNAGPVRRNGFLSAGNLSEAFSYDRVEIIRGPQALLFGTVSTRLRRSQARCRLQLIHRA